MKRKTFKINQNTLFVYKQNNGKQSKEPTEPTTAMTMTTQATSGIFGKHN